MATPPQQTYYIVLLPASGEEPSNLRPLSRLLEESESAVAQRLRCPAYQVLRRYAKKGNAESFHGQLHALGVESLVLSDTQVAGHLFLWASTANQGQGGMAFKDFGGQPLYCPFDDIIAVCVAKVLRRDDTTTMLIDLHRRSTPITPRLDAALFDFEQVMTRSGADADLFLEELQDRLPLIEFDAGFADAAEALEPAVTRGLAKLPGEFAPPHDRLAAPYDSLCLKLFDVYSFLQRERRIAGI